MYAWKAGIGFGEESPYTDGKQASELFKGMLARAEGVREAKEADEIRLGGSPRMYVRLGAAGELVKANNLLHT